MDNLLKTKVTNNRDSIMFESVLSAIAPSTRRVIRKRHIVGATAFDTETVTLYLSNGKVARFEKLDTDAYAVLEYLVE